MVHHSPRDSSVNECDEAALARAVDSYDFLVRYVGPHSRLVHSHTLPSIKERVEKVRAFLEKGGDSTDFACTLEELEELAKKAIKKWHDYNQPPLRSASDSPALVSNAARREVERVVPLDKMLWRR